MHRTSKMMNLASAMAPSGLHYLSGAAPTAGRRKRRLRQRLVGRPLLEALPRLVSASRSKGKQSALGLRQASS